MKWSVNNIGLLGVAAAVPRRRLDLASLKAEYGDLEVQRIIKSTGIETVRVAGPELTAADLCEQAAKELLAALRMQPDEVDAIVFVSQTPDYILPATSVCLQHRLGLRKDVPAFDIPYGCSGYIYGLFQAGLLIGAGACRNVLVCVGDTMTRLVNRGDRSTRMVFGDAGSASLLCAGTTAASFSIYSDGAGAKHLIVPAGGFRLPKSVDTAQESQDAAGNVRSPENIFMDGTEIMAFALREVPKVIDDVLGLAGWSKESVGFYGLHQANKFMVDYLAKKCRLPKGSTPVGVRNTGNAGPVSIPLLLCVLRDELPPERRARSVLCGFGVGLSWAACAMDLGATMLLPLVEVGEAG